MLSSVSLKNSRNAPTICVNQNFESDQRISKIETSVARIEVTLSKFLNNNNRNSCQGEELSINSY